MVKPLIVLGAGGHASVLVDILRQQERKILAVVSPDDIQARGPFTGLKVLASDDGVMQFDATSVLLVNGLGSIPGRGGAQQTVS